jgi:hypothetical protein
LMPADAGASSSGAREFRMTRRGTLVPVAKRDSPS